MSWFPAPAAIRRVRFGWVDLLVLTGFLLLLVGVIHLGSRLTVPLRALGSISLAPANLPVYAGESLLRIFIAFLFSLGFAIAYGYVAAKVHWAGRVLIPLLDVLQSVPVLGFLSATVALFAGLFPGSETGFELASIFAIFTAQAWNMTFSFYHTLVTVPRDLHEAAQVYGLDRWRRLWYLELPSSAIPLVLNSMMSFGGSWFFLAASETVNFGGRNVVLPGVGSYMATAEQRGNVPAMVAAVLVMVVLIVAVDQLFWRPIIAWSQKFKIELTQSPDPPQSFILTLLRRSALIELLQEKLLNPVGEWITTGASRRTGHRQADARPERSPARWIALALGASVAAYAGAAGYHLLAHLSWTSVLQVAGLGALTFLRVAAAVLLGALWTVPVGVWVGLNPRVYKWAQPLAQIAASFPANMLFPVVVALLLRVRLGLDIGAVPLMMLGTQWYILFNVIAGSISIPRDLREAANVFQLQGLGRWRTLILPAIFPSLITGGVTAAGGAWNASIVAEVASWNGHTLVAHGVGAYISLATATGHPARILLGIAVMAMLVIATNRLIWQPLYRLAETKYHLE